MAAPTGGGVRTYAQGDAEGGRGNDFFTHTGGRHTPPSLTTSEIFSTPPRSTPGHIGATAASAGMSSPSATAGTREEDAGLHSAACPAPNSFSP